MNCKIVQERIDEVIYDKEAIINQDIQVHFNTCNSCNRYYLEAKKDSQLLSKLRNMEPVLTDPKGLTDSIMQSVVQDETRSKTKDSKYRLITRLLAAAVIALLITFGIEQYVVLDKIQMLEMELGKVQPSHSISRNQIYNASLLDIDMLTNNLKQEISFKKISTLIQLKQARQFNFTFYDFDRNMIKDELKKYDLTNRSQQMKD